MDRFEEMRAFVSVVDSNGFTQAARKLGVSRAAVSKHIMKLEERLGVRLLHRTTRRVSVTPIGKRFYERTTKLLAELTEVEDLAAEKDRVPSGPMRILAPVNFALTQLGSAVARFLHAYPLVKLELILSDRGVDPIEAGYDLAVRVGNPDVAAHTGLDVCTITRSKRILCASPAYLAKNGKPGKPKELINHQCLSYSYIEQPNLWHLFGKGKRHVIRVSGPVITSSGQVLKAAAEAGLGIAYGPRSFFSENLENGSLRQVLEDYELPQVSVYSVYPTGRRQLANVTGFNKFMVAYFNQNQ